VAVASWSEKVSVVAVQKVSNGGTARGTLALGTAFGAYLFLRLGRLTATAPAVGCYARIRRFLRDNANSRDVPHPAPLALFQDGTVASNLTTISALTAGPPGSFTLATATGFAANQTVCLVDNATTPTRAEWHQTSKIATSVLTLDRAYANIASGDTITNNALVLPPVWVDGGVVSYTDFEVIFDYGAETATSPIVVEAWAQTLDSIS
jgi:hypothetical protein